mgnify:CR=1 FL=1
MQEFLRHFFLPHEGNNHRAKLLHHTSLLALISIFFVGAFLFPLLKTSFPDVLGIAVNISSVDLLSFTNQKRAEKKLGQLYLNSQLSQAATQKANNMLAHNYWAHTSPAGATPWKFIKESGYSYIYAGENLARGFSDSKSVIDAWMASPTHRSNMLSGNYQDVGFAVAQGKLGNEDTVLVVEMFGGKKASLSRAPGPSVPIASNTLLSSVLSNAVVDSNFLVRTISIGMAGLFIITLLLDMIIVERKKIIRIVGHNSDHVLFFCAIIVFIILMSRGAVG